MTRHLLKLVWKRKRGNALLIVEILCSFLVLFAVLTLGSAMVMRYERPLGFDYENVWTIRLAFASEDTTAAKIDERWAVVERMMNELRAMPQVESVSATNMGAYTGGSWTSSASTPQGRINMDRDRSTDDYAKTMGIRMLSGRWFGPEDDAARIEPVVIDRDLAEIYFGKEDPTGRELSFNRDETVRVIGVVPPFRRKGEFSSDRNYTVFGRAKRPAWKPGTPDDPRMRFMEAVPRNIVIRVVPGTSAAFEEQIGARLHTVDREIPLRIERLDQARAITIRKMLTTVVLGSVVGLFLISMVALGLSGVLWQNVTRRTRELGLRRALGATGREVNRQILTEVALLSTLALVVGLIVVAQLPIVGIFNFVTPLAYGVGIAGSLLMIYALTLASGLYPGLLAGRVTPADALRHD